MSLEWTQTPRRAVNQAQGPLRVVDPDSKREYILLRADLYDRMRSLLEAEVVDPSLYEFEERENPR